MTWGPLFALSGYGLELFSGAGTNAVLWLSVGAGLAALTALWVYARRRFLSVRVTDDALWLGGERLALADIAEVDDVDAPLGTRVLGGALGVPRTFCEVPLRLSDGAVVLAWARDGAALREALREAAGRTEGTGNSADREASGDGGTETGTA
nr:hypothetical protein [Saccharomonospora xinjiangensis]